MTGPSLQPLLQDCATRETQSFHQMSEAAWRSYLFAEAPLVGAALHLLSSPAKQKAARRYGTIRGGFYEVKASPMASFLDQFMRTIPLSMAHVKENLL